MVLNGKNVLVTGADGFIGSHLVERLVTRGAVVHALSYYNSFNNWGWLEEVACKKEINVLAGDIRDSFYCEYILKNIDVVFNLAALIAIPYSYTAPKSYFETNVLGTLNVCEASLKNHVERLIHVSTSEVYGTALYVPIDEKHPLQPQSPYSASKIGADSIALSYHYSFDLPVIIARPFFEISIGEAFETIRKIMKSDAVVVRETQRVRPEKSEVRRLWADNAKLIGLTGFKPSYSLLEGLELTVEWFMNPENLKKYKSEVYNV